MNQTELLHMNFPHLRDLKPFDTAHSATPWLADSEAKHSRKLCASIEEAVKRCGLQDGMTISFHHAFREGDRVINTVVALLARMGFKNLTLGFQLADDLQRRADRAYRKRRHHPDLHLRHARQAGGCHLSRADGRAGTNSLPRRAREATPRTAN